MNERTYIDVYVSILERRASVVPSSRVTIDTCVIKKARKAKQLSRDIKMFVKMYIEIHSIVTDKKSLEISSNNTLSRRLFNDTYDITYAQV